MSMTVVTMFMLFLMSVTMVDMLMLFFMSITVVAMLMLFLMSMNMVDMLMTLMPMFFTLFNAVYQHLHLTSAYPAFHHDFSGNLYARYSEAVHLRNKTLLLFGRQEFKKCRGQHISCGAHS
jgi:hypothetical protein